MCGEETTIILRLHLFITFHIQQIEWKTDTSVKKDKLFLFFIFFLVFCWAVGANRKSVMNSVGSLELYVSD
jgi:hypothetical protein